MGIIGVTWDEVERAARAIYPELYEGASWDEALEVGTAGQARCRKIATLALLAYKNPDVEIIK